MKVRAVSQILSGLAVALLISVIGWQLVVIGLLVRAMADVLGLLGGVF